MRVTVERGDLTRVSTDAIVNAANATLLGGGGVDGAIHDAAGPELLEACRALPESAPGVRCPTGEARLTPAFRLPARWVIHTVGPIHHRERDPAAALGSAIRSSLALAVAHGLRAVAFPAISCGAYGYPVAEAADVMVGVAIERGWSLDEVRFVLFGDGAHRAFVRAAAGARWSGAADPPPFRRADDADDAAIAGIIRTVMPTFGASGAGFAITDPEVDHMARAYRAPRSAYFVVEREGRVVGGGGLAPLAGAEPSVCELRKMYFLPEARGAGAGERLLRQALVVATGFGYRTCYLETLTGMDAAVRLYEKVGFRRIASPLGATGHHGCDRYYARSL